MPGATAVVRHPARLHPAILVATVAAAAVSFIAAPGLPGAIGAALAIVMTAIAAADARAYIIPDGLIGVALLLAAAQTLSSDGGPAWQALALAALRGAVAALLFYAIRAAYRRWRGRHGLGLGDVKLAAVAGAMLGWTALPLAVEIATLAALGYFGYLYYVKKQRVHARSRLPFGLFLAPAIWLGWLLDATLLAPN